MCGRSVNEEFPLSSVARDYGPVMIDSVSVEEYVVAEAPVGTESCRLPWLAFAVPLLFEQPPALGHAIVPGVNR
jgi:hypothetical protein